MFTRTCRWLTLIAVSLAGSAASAQDRSLSLPVDRLDREDGLPASDVSAVAQDHRGFLWIATAQGLVRYDGKDFVTAESLYRESNAWTSKQINDIHVDGRGRIWVATTDRGVAWYDPARRDSREYRFEPDNPDSLSSDNVWRIFEDEQGGLWFGTFAGGLSHFDPASDTFTRYRHDPEDPRGLAADVVPDIVGDGQGGIWVATLNGGVNRLEPGSGEFQRFGTRQGLCHDRVWQLLLDGQGRLWAGTEAGLARLDPGSDRFRCLGDGGRASPPFAGRAIDSLYLDDRDSLWVSFGRQTLGIYRPATGTFTPAELFDGKDRIKRLGLIHHNVTRDDGGVIWLPGENGLIRLRPTWRNFTTWLRGAGPDGRPLPVRAVHETREGIVWAGTNRYGLVRYDPASGERRHYTDRADSEPRLPNDRVLAIEPAGDGRFWLGTHDGVTLFDPDRASVTSWSHRHAPGMAGEGYVADLHLDGEGGLWVATAGGGLKRFDTGSEAFTDQFMTTSAPGRRLQNDTLNFVTPAPDGSLLVGHNKGLDRLDPGSGRVKPVLGAPAGAGARPVAAAHEDDDGTLWVATGDSLLRLAPAGDGHELAARYAGDDGLPAESVQDLAVIDEAVWLATRRSLVRFDPAGGGFTTYGDAEGLPDVALADALEWSRSGYLYAALADGLVRFRSESLEVPETAPRLVLTGIQIMNRHLGPGEMQLPLRLDHHDRMVRFDFAALDFAAPERLRYAYRLQGFDSNWIQAGDRSEGAYTNLPPGAYTFQVRSTNSYGAWQPAGLAVPLTMAPPPWRTWWAYGLYTLAGLALLGGVFLAYRRKVARDHQLERERDQRQWAQDLHDLTRSLAASLKSEEILSRYLDGLARAVRYESGIVYLAPRGAEPVAVGRGYTGTHRPPHTRQLRRALTTVRGSQQPVDLTLENGTTRQILALPLLWRSEVLGVVLLERTAPFSPRERSTALALGEQAGTALENARLFGEVERLAHDAQAANRAKSDFLARMSHEIRTPMNGVLGMAELLMESELTSEQRTYARAVKDSGDLLLALINDILDFSRIEAGKLELAEEDFDLGRMLAEIVTLFGARAVDKGLAFTYEIDSDVPRELRGDPQRLRQVFMNLVGNAFKFTEQGQVSIRVGLERSDGEAVVLACEVADTGIGIPRSARADLFQAFSQLESATARRYGGTGLGLAICRELTEKMGGRIGVDSEPGRGSRFHFTVRLERAREPGTAQPSAAALAGRRILLACRDQATRRGLAAMLGNLGAATETAEEALTVAPGTCDAVLADWDHPIAHRAGAAGAPVVVLIPFGGGPPESVWRGRGAAGAVRVPVREPELVGRLLALLEGEAAAPDADAGGSREPDRPMNILVVEDSPIGQEVIQDLLENWGHRVDVVDSGREALYGLQQRSYELVLLDCELPGMDGVEVATAIRNLEREGRLSGHIPVVALTGRASTEHRAQCIAAGMDDYLGKPVTGETLRALVRRWGEAAEPASPNGG